MPAQKHTEVVIRGNEQRGFELLDPVNLNPIAKPVKTLSAAFESARLMGATLIWQQPVDSRGRPQGQPFRVALSP
jgi:hypothetical protein